MRDSVLLITDVIKHQHATIRFLKSAIVVEWKGCHTIVASISRFKILMPFPNATFRFCEFADRFQLKNYVSRIQSQGVRNSVGIDNTRDEIWKAPIWIFSKNETVYIPRILSNCVLNKGRTQQNKYLISEYEKPNTRLYNTPRTLKSAATSYSCKRIYKGYVQNQIK